MNSNFQGQEFEAYNGAAYTKLYISDILWRKPTRTDVERLRHILTQESDRRYLRHETARVRYTI
jgi:hypothetical protein